MSFMGMTRLNVINDQAHASLTYDYIEARNSIIDEFDASRDERNYNTSKWAFDYEVEFIGKFQNNLECGNITLSEDLIDKVRFKTKFSDQDEWITFDEQDYDPDQIIYKAKHFYCWANIPTDYAIVPVVNGVEYNFSQDSITPKYEGLWLCDLNSTHRMLVDLDYDDIEHNTRTSVVEPLNAVKPFTISNNMDYCSGTATACILSDEGITGSREVTTYSEKKWREEFISYVKSKKAKYLKDDCGRAWIVNTYGVKEKLDPFNRNITEVTFNWVDIGDATSQEELVENALLPDIS